MNELIELADRIHNTSSSILVKYHAGVELNEDEEEFLSDLFIVKEEGRLNSLDDILITENKYIKLLIMPRGIPKAGKRNMNKNNSDMKLDLNSNVLALDGKTINQSPDTPWTVKNVLKTAVLNCDIDKKSGKEKFDLYNLAIKIDKEEDLTIEELNTCKESVGKIFNPEVVGFVWSILETKK